MFELAGMSKFKTRRSCVEERSFFGWLYTTVVSCGLVLGNMDESIDMLTALIAAERGTMHLDWRRSKYVLLHYYYL
jgi:hypothetical protein